MKMFIFISLLFTDFFHYTKEKCYNDDGCMDFDQNCNCESCYPGYFINNNGHCFSCGSACYKCSDLNTCNKCYNGFYLSEGKCNSCMSNCQICSSSSFCSKCENGYYYSNSKCLKCDSNCETCQNQASMCLSCKEQNYLNFDNSCLKCKEIS